MGNNLMYEIISNYLSEVESGERDVTSEDYIRLTKLYDKILESTGQIREVLFRGKDETGQWNYGFYVRSPCPDSNDGPVMHGIVLRCYVESFDYPGRTGKRDWEIIQVDPTTVGEYIGTKDKNGQKIFEGDILEYEAIPCEEYERSVVCRCKVVFRNSSFAFESISGSETDVPLAAVLELKATVIGNIYDNPELLEGGGMIAE